MHKPVNVIYILGLGHSGSTLLNILLGSHSLIEGVGELSYFWEYFSDDLPEQGKKSTCSCKAPVTECEYWREVRNEMQTIIGKTDANHKLDEQVLVSQKEYYLMKVILKLSGKEVICDSSKQYSRLKTYLKSPLFNVLILHVVRDGHAVAYSWKKKGERTGKTAKAVYNFYKQIKVWSEINTRYYSEFGNFDKYFLIKYEHLVSDPQHYVSKILEIANSNFEAELKFESDQLNFWKFKHHEIASNGMAKKGQQEIKIDRDYLKGLSNKEWWYGNFLAFSGLRLFNYPLFKSQVQDKNPKAS